MDDGRGEPDPTLAVIAHTLLTDVALVAGILKKLRREWDDLGDARRTEFMHLAAHQADRMRSVIEPLVRGLPLEALRVLEKSLEVRVETRAALARRRLS